ncbi:GlxA family transcriptional regulator [Rhizobium sp. BK251]|uniref:GlxA family transcriptional regulator n=1 Tax=Rhizobium sp. BK251 TaxID=2512125 RepID=UPI00105142D2|nr:GlxA family transcriptional regulator [Rhizobium sp. BK251]TCL68415.1 AraC family transcriptional regulator with amidase-like domain [Rhizobium sp. BK251]
MQRIALLLYPGFQVMALAAISVFEFANLAVGETAYEVSFLSETGGPIRSSAGLVVETTPFHDPTFDTVLVAGGPGVVIPSEGLQAFVQQALASSRRLAAICTGAFVLAEADILNGRRATTHWAAARNMKTRFPKIKVEEDRIFIVDGSVWTSAGMTAGIDLTLAMVENDLGPDVARDVARNHVVYHRRAGGQSQFSTLLELDAKSDRIQNALDYAKRNLQTPLSVEQLAEAANLSPRQFSRAFSAETGQSPAKAIESLRVEAARLLMEQGRHSIDVIARETGFADRERMRRAFLRAFGQPPQAMRRNARASTEA